MEEDYKFNTVKFKYSKFNKKNNKSPTYPDLPPPTLNGSKIMPSPGPRKPPRGSKSGIPYSGYGFLVTTGDGSLAISAKSGTGLDLENKTKMFWS